MELLCKSVIKDVEQLGWVYGIKSNRIMNANDIEIIKIEKQAYQLATKG
jgi:hypothetical protein